MTNDNRGTLGRNKRREKDTHPEYSGQATIGGVDYWVSGWVKTSSRDGEKFFSLSFREKTERARDLVEQKPSRQEPDPFDSGDIPF